MSFELMTSALRRARSRQLEAASQATGERRSVVVAALADIGDDLAFTVRYDTGFVAVTGTGGEFVTPEVKTEEGKPVVARGRRLNEDHRNVKLDGGLPGAAWANKKIGGLTIPCGVCLIVGPGGVGKSPLAQALASNGVDTFGMVRIGEPLAGYTSSNDTSARSLAAAMIHSSDVVLDSIKDLLSSGSGAAMKSGISRTALSSLAAWSALACDLGCTIYVPVNPSTKDPEVMELLTEAARSNATMTIAHQKNDSWQYWARKGEGLNRTAGVLSLKWTNGEASVTVDGRAITEVTEREAGLAISTRLHDWDGVLRRSILSVGARNVSDSE